jgi:hypothetical protein
MEKSGAATAVPRACVICMQGDARSVGHVALALRCQLLQGLQRSDVARYGEFRATCDTAATTISQIATASLLRQSEDHDTDAATASHQKLLDKRITDRSQQHGHLVAALRGAVRRLAEPDERFFHEAEHAGMAAFFTLLKYPSARQILALTTAVSRGCIIMLPALKRLCSMCCCRGSGGTV